MCSTFLTKQLNHYPGPLLHYYNNRHNNYTIMPPQIFQVLRCYKCSVFQVHQSKKSNKWECKLCGEKQSIKRHYGLGTAKDCRLHVQRLNGLRGEIDELKEMQDSGSSDGENHALPVRKTSYLTKENSKWLNYVEEAEVVEENSNENMSLEGAEVVLDLPKKRRKTCHNNFRKNLNATSVQNENVRENFNYGNADTPYKDVDNTKAQSILSKPVLQFTDLSPKKRVLNHSRSKFTPPVLNKNSKWAQFTEDAAESELDLAPTPSTAASQTDLLFSLCDDSDLDNVLDI